MNDPLKTINPATGELLNTYPRMSDAEMQTAIEQCHAAYQDWRQRSNTASRKPPSHGSSQTEALRRARDRAVCEAMDVRIYLQICK